MNTVPLSLSRRHISKDCGPSEASLHSIIVSRVDRTDQKQAGVVIAHSVPLFRII